MSRETFDTRSALVKKTLKKFEGKIPTGKVEEGLLSAEQIKTNLLLDMKMLIMIHLKVIFG